jgi:hypothetical protein
MTFREKYVALSDTPSFETVLDQTCDRLWDRKIQHVIRVIRKLEKRLCELERELDAMVLPRDEDRTK